MLTIIAPAHPFHLSAKPTIALYSKFTNDGVKTSKQEDGVAVGLPFSKRFNVSLNVGWLSTYPYLKKEPAQWTAGISYNYNLGKDYLNLQVYTKTKCNLLGKWIQEAGFKKTLWAKGKNQVVLNTAFQKNANFAKHKDDGWNLGITFSHRF